MSVSSANLDLKNPGLAALLAWLVPGLGHIYQRRMLKGVLFFFTICGLFFFGSWLGSWRVVYLRWDNEEWRFSYLAQFAVGLPALPAVLDGLDARPAFAAIVPPLADYESKPLSLREVELLCERLELPRSNKIEDADKVADMSDRIRESGVKYLVTMDEVDDLHRRYGVTMHIATIYTLIAGLLNVLVIYDAAAGPAHLREDEAEDEAKRSKEPGAAG